MFGRKNDTFIGCLHKSPPNPRMPISVTQALAELKLLDKRIRKVYEPKSSYSEYDSHSVMTWVAVKTKASPVDAEQLKRDAQADWQSFSDLVARRDKIKRAIVLSNATTRVKVGDWEGTVAEAVEHKSSIQYKKEFVKHSKFHLTTVETEFKKKQKEVQDRLDKLLQSELGKDVRTNPETIQAITTSFLENNKVEMVDPLQLANKIRKLEEEIETFETNVDWVLSECNGRTMVDV